MQTSEYNKACKELAELTHQATRLDGLDAATRTELEKIRSEILANHYKIVLLGSFQGGKSTIFNTACGGRQLSPTGFGLKTSACAAEAHYLEEGQEFARVLWRSDEEILLGFIEALLPHLVDIAPDRFKGKGPAEAAAGLDLSQTVDHSLLDDAYHRSRDEYQKDRRAFAGDHADLLKIAGLTLRHYEKVRQTRTGMELREDKIPVTIASEWVRFPGDWFERDLKDLETHEVMFLFIRCVEFHISSRELQQLRAVLVDSPGLQASAWDTRIATECIQASDAIVWLQGTDGRELSQSELEVARRFSEYGITHEGVFIAFNAKGVSETASQRILSANLKSLANKADFSIPPERVIIFNALLALRAKQYVLLEEGKLPRESIDRLSELALQTIPAKKLTAGGNDVLQNAKLLIRRDLRAAALHFLNEEIDAFDATTLDQLMEAAHWQQAIDQATQFIIKHRGRSRLMDRGSLRVQRALEQFRQNLVLREETAGKTVNTHRKEKEEADKALQEFEERADGLKYRLDRELNCLKSPEELTELFENLLGELGGRLWHGSSRQQMRRELEQLIHDSEDERDVAPAIRKRVSDYVQKRVAGWQADLKAGKSDAARKLYIEMKRKVNDEMQRLLETALGRGGDLLKGLDFELPDLNVTAINDYQADSIRRHLFTDFDKALDWLEQKIPGFSHLRDGYQAIRNFFWGEPFNRHAWKERLTTYLDAVFGESLNQFLSKHVIEYLTAYKEAVMQQIDQATAKFRRDYEQRVAQRDQDLEVGTNRQKEIARDCEVLRTGIIEPFQRKLDDFTKGILLALEESETHENEMEAASPAT